MGGTWDFLKFFFFIIFFSVKENHSTNPKSTSVNCNVVA